MVRVLLILAAGALVGGGLTGCDSYDYPRDPHVDDMIGTWIHHDEDGDTVLSIDPDGRLTFTGLPVDAPLGPIPATEEDPFDSPHVDGGGSWSRWTGANQDRGGYPTIDVFLSSPPTLPGVQTTLQNSSDGVFFYTHGEPELRFEFERAE